MIRFMKIEKGEAMIEDLKQWSRVPDRILRAVLLGVWEALGGINCAVAHRRYHNFPFNSPYIRVCVKCGRREHLGAD